MRNKLTSSLPPLKPVRVWDAKTGEVLSLAEWNKPVSMLLTTVTQAVSKYYDTKQEFLHEVCGKSVRNPAEFARQANITLPLNLPATVKAQSRVQRLARHKLVSEVSSYVLNPNPRKQPPNFIPKINLGAVDKQMATLSLDRDTLTLLWKVWDKEFLFEFTIPGYVLARNIVKWSLPSVQHSRKTGDIIFYFTVVENTAPRPVGSLVAGVDLGRTGLYTMSVVNPKGHRVAHYTSNGRLKQLNQKRERLLQERKQILRKLTTYEKLNHNPQKQQVLRTEATRKRDKITRIGVTLAQQVGADITKKLAKHKVNTLNLENLTWVTGSKYGSRWNHSKQQEAITHSLARIGVRTRKVTPRNTSNTCYKCGNTITHNTKNRTVWCTDCKTRLDRDLNASLNIARTKQSYPVTERDNGGNLTLKREVTVGTSPGSGLRQESSTFPT